MREKWSLEEAVVLLEYYFESRGEYKDSELQNIRSMFIKRAKAFEICYDEKPAYQMQQKYFMMLMICL